MTAGATYEPIATTTLTSTASSVTFSSISGSYTDLIISGRIIGTISSYLNMQVGNGSVDTGANYSITTLIGRYNQGSDEAGGGQYTSTNAIYPFGDTWYSTNPTVFSINLQNYSNTTTNKTILIRSGAYGTTNYIGTAITVGSWRSTSAINIITLSAGSSTFAAGSSFTLYGISAA